MESATKFNFRGHNNKTIKVSRECAMEATKPSWRVGSSNAQCKSRRENEGEKTEQGRRGRINGQSIRSTVFFIN